MNQRRPGHHTFWTVEFLSTYGEPHWVVVGDHHLSRIPYELRWVKVDGHVDRKQMEPHREFSASGAVWQATGNHGFTTPEPAVTLMMQLAAANPDEQFRVVKATISWRNEVVLTMNQKEAA